MSQQSIIIQQSSNVLEDHIHLVLADIKLLTGKEIGGGAYGKVFQADYCGSECAAKEFNITVALDVSREVNTKGIHKTKESRLFKKCLRILQLRHPNIVQFLGIFYKPGSSTVPLLVTELMDTSLSVLVKEYPNIPTNAKLSILLDVSLGLKFLHSQKPSVVHCHLSSNNVLLTPHLQAKISDVGVALIVPEKLLKQRLKDACFVAPEVKCSMPEPSIDVFSFGAITIHIVSQHWPDRSLVNMVKQPNFKFVHDQSQLSLSDKEFWSLATECLGDDPHKRPPIAKVSEKIKKMTGRYPAAPKRNAIAWQTEVQQVIEQVVKYIRT